MHTSLAIFGLPGGGEWIILLILGLLLFGRRLPEVGRSIGRSIVEFKRGVKGIDDDIEEEASRRPDSLEDKSGTSDWVPRGEKKKKKDKDKEATVSSGSSSDDDRRES